MATGVVKTAESMAIEVVRLLILATQREGVAQVTVIVADEVATFLNNKKRRELAKLEDEGSVIIQILGARTFRRSIWFSNASTPTAGRSNSRFDPRPARLNRVDYGASPALGLG